jgi:hypothetical protein
MLLLVDHTSDRKIQATCVISIVEKDYMLFIVNVCLLSLFKFECGSVAQSYGVVVCYYLDKLSPLFIKQYTPILEVIHVNK